MNNQLLTKIEESGISDGSRVSGLIESIRWLKVVIKYSLSVRSLQETLPNQSGQLLTTLCEKAVFTSSAPTTNTVTGSQSKPSSPRLVRRYSKPQEHSADISQQDSLDSEEIIDQFQQSLPVWNPIVAQRHLSRRRSSPELLSLARLINQRSTAVANSGDQSESSVQPPPPLSNQSILAKMVGTNRKPSSFFSSLTQTGSDSSSSSQGALIEGRGENENNDINRLNNALSTLSTSQGQVTCVPGNGTSNIDSVDASSSLQPTSSSSGFGFLSKTRQFGAWLTNTVEGDKVDITKKDLNVFAPTTF